MARIWRVHHPHPDSSPGSLTDLDPDESHHVRRVLRLREGESVTVFDGRGREWEATLEVATSDRVAFAVGRELEGRIEAPVRISLFSGVERADRMDLVVQKATELGVAAIHPLAPTARKRRPASAARLQRWRRIALEACKQSGRRELPRVEPREGLPEPEEASVTALLLDPGPASRPIGDVLLASPGREVWLATGAEGGFREAELAAGEARGWVRVRLGPRVLRAETAALAAVAVVQHRWGDLGSGAV